MSERSVDWIIANAINEQARGDPDALAAEIIAALAEAGHCITPATEDTALGSQPFDELKPEMRPQDTYGDGRDWTFETLEHGGDEPDNMPQAIRATDPAGPLGGLCPAHTARQDRGPAPVFRDGYRAGARLMTIRSFEDPVGKSSQTVGRRSGAGGRATPPQGPFHCVSTGRTSRHA
jgi:hypothetical protein